MRRLLLSFTIISLISVFYKCANNPTAKSSSEDTIVQISNTDDSNLSDSLKNLYYKDAAKLAVTEMNQDSILKSTILIPDSMLSKYYNALILIYNASIIKQVENVKMIHDYHAGCINQFYISFDTSSSWTGNWLNGIVETGINEIDDIFQFYEVKIYSIHLGDHYNSVILETGKFVNNKVFPTLFTNIDSINQVGIQDLVGSGNILSSAKKEDVLILTYSIGWGDCPCGCIYRHYWEFAIRGNEVRFVREYGDDLP